MPGRPKKMAKRVTELEERAALLEADVSELTPRQYIEGDDCGPDPLGLGQAWRNATDAAFDAYMALGKLGEILRDKAGIENWEPDDEDWEPGDEIDIPAPSDPEPGQPETTETPQAAEREPDDTLDSADTRSGRA